jgi:diguanylate cyclase (GGDEF)-like protein/PAS domain S-box-containing protein
MSLFSINSVYGEAIFQDMRYVHVDDNYARIYGYENAQELLSERSSLLDIIHVDSHDKITQKYAEIITGQRAPKGETYQNIDRFGKNITIFAVDHVIEWQGKPALQVSVVDLTPHVKLELKTREQDRIYRDMIMNSGQGILVHRDFKPLLVNQSWVDMQGADSIEQVLALDSILPLLTDAERDKILKHYQNLVRRNISGTSTVVENIGFDGKHRFFNIYDNAINYKGDWAVQVTLEDVTEKVALERKLIYQASHDELTDLFNRRATADWLDTQLEQKNDVTCILLDIDNFKMINDSHGHAIGDQVIIALSRLVKATLKTADGIAGRWGGEEFIALIANSDLQKALCICEKICKDFNQQTFVGKNQLEFNVSVSIGLSDTRVSSSPLSADALFRLTDRCLYQAKARGKNCLVVDEKLSS